MSELKKPTARKRLHDFHALAIATVAGLGLLVIAANLQSPRWWLIAPGWAILALCISIRWIEPPATSPYKNAFALVGIAFLFYFALWEGAFRRVLNLLFEPSLDHLISLLINKGFLALAILYFASVCLFYSMELHKCREDLAGCRKGRSQEDIDAEREWREYLNAPRDDW